METFLRWVEVFVRVYAALWGVSAAGYFAVKVMCLESLLDLEPMLDFRLPDVMFSRPVKWQDVKE